MSKPTPTIQVTFRRTLTAVSIGALCAILGIVLTLATILSPATTGTATAATSDTLNFQARLQSSSGNIVPDGNYHIEFKIHTDLSASGGAQGTCSGACVWQETRTTGNLVRVVNGYFSVNLGSVTPFGTSIDWDQQLWLSMNIGGASGSASWDGEMTPRIKLTGVPYAYTAGELVKRTDASNSTKIVFDTPSGNNTITAPAASGTLCLTSGNCADTTTLQSAYNLSSPASITLNSTNGGFTIRDGSPVLGANLLQIQNNVGSTNYFTVTTAGMRANSLTSISGNLNLGTTGTTRFTIQSGLTTSTNPYQMSNTAMNTSLISTNNARAAILLQGTGDPGGNVIVFGRQGIGADSSNYLMGSYAASGGNFFGVQRTGSYSGEIGLMYGTGTNKTVASGFRFSDTSGVSFTDYGTRVGRLAYSGLQLEGYKDIELTATCSDTGGSLGAGTYYFRVMAYYNENTMYGMASTTSTSCTVGSGSSGSVSLSWLPYGDSGASSYRIYKGTAPEAENIYFKTTTTSYIYTSDEGAHTGSPCSNCLNHVTQISGITDSFIGTRLGIRTTNVMEALTLSSDSNMIHIMSSPSAEDVRTELSAGGSLTEGISHSYYVSALNASGETQASSYNINISKIPTTGNQTIEVSWASVPGATSYNVYRWTAATGTHFIANTTNTSLSDSGIVGVAASTPSVNTAYINKISGIGTSWFTGSVGVGTINATAKLHVAGTSGSDKNLVLQAGSGQTGNLFETQDSSGNILTSIGATGNLNVSGNITVGADSYLTITGGTTANRPTSPTEGMIWFDTDTKQLLTYSNGKWQADRSTATKIVAAGNSSQSAKDSADYVANGEIGDGVTTVDGDQLEINAAITAVNAAGGGTVYLLAGNYLLDAPIQLRSNVILSGAGNATNIQIASGAGSISSITLSASDGTVDDFGIRDLWAAGGGGTAPTIRLENTSGTSSHVRIYNIKASGATSGASANSIVLRGFSNLTVNDSYFSSENGLSLYTIADSVFTNNTISGATDTNRIGLYLYAGTKVTIADNVFNGNRTPVYLWETTESVISGNKLLCGSGSGVLATNTSSKNIISNNTIKSCVSVGINIDSTSLSNIVDANRVEGTGNAAISVHGPGSTVTNNVVSNAAWGIYSTGSDINISGNNIEGSTNHGVYVVATRIRVTDNRITGSLLNGIYALNAHDNVISGNYVHDSGGINAYDGVRVVDSNNVNVTNNRITDTAGAGYAMSITGTSADAYLANNSFSGTGAVTINDLGSNTVYSSQSTGANGANLVNRTADSAVAFQIQAGDGTRLLTADSSNDRIVLGQSSSMSGNLTFANVTNANTVSIVSGVTSTSYSLTLPTAQGGTGECLVNSDGAGTLGWTSCGGGSSPTLQVAYDNSSSPATILTTASTKNVIIRSGVGFESTGAFQVQDDAGIAVFNVDTTNSRVGIGTGAPTESLHIQSAGRASIFLEADTDNSGEYENPFIKFSQDAGDSGGLIGFNPAAGFGPDGSALAGALSNGAYFGTYSSDALQLGTDQTARLTILSGGKVGIGTNAPEYKLDVHTSSGEDLIGLTSASDTSTVRPTINFKRARGTADVPSQTLTGDYLGGINFSGYMSSGAYRTAASIQVQSSGNFSSGMSYGTFRFMTRDGGGGDQERFTIQSDGNVGVGASAPTARLHISSNDTDPLLRVTDETVTARDVLLIADGGATTFRNQTDSGNGFQIQNAAGTTFFNAATDSNTVWVASGTALGVDGTGNARLIMGTGVMQLANLNASGGIQIQSDAFTVQDTTGWNNNLYIDNAGSVLFKNRVDSGAGFRVENSAGAVLWRIDTQDDQVVFGTASSTAGRFILHNASNANTVTVTSGVLAASYTLNFPDLPAGTYDICTSQGNCGGGSSTKLVTLMPEYPGATMTGDGTNNAGAMSSDFCSGTSRKSINTAVCAATEEHNYYSWTSTSGDNDYDIYVRYQVPSGFTAFSANDTIKMYGWRTDNTNNTVELALFQANGTQCGTTTNVATGTGTWSEVALSGSETSCSIAANDVIVFRVRMTATVGEFARAGAIRFEYEGTN